MTSKVLVIIHSGNGLLHDWHQAIFWTNADMSSMKRPGINPDEISINVHYYMQYILLYYYYMQYVRL